MNLIENLHDEVQVVDQTLDKKDLGHDLGTTEVPNNKIRIQI